MNETELVRKVVQAMDDEVKRQGYACTVEVLIDIGCLDRKKYEEWRKGEVDYLERVCSGSLSKLTLVNRTVRLHAKERGLKPSYSAYNRWGKGKGMKLRFSKSGLADIERHYATHYVDTLYRGGDDD